MSDFNGTDSHWPCDDDEEGIDEFGYGHFPEDDGPWDEADEGTAFWKNRDGSLIAVDDMTDDHLNNAIRMMSGWDRRGRTQHLFTALCDERDARAQEKIQS